MRRAAALLVAAGVCGLATGATAAPAPRSTVLDLGDSLSVGTAPFLRAQLRGYQLRHMHQVGLHASDVLAIVTARRGFLPPVLVISAGTNDDPRIVAAFWHAVSRVVQTAGPGRCVVWPTIVRPPAVGMRYDGLNRALARNAARHRNLVLVDWVGIVRSHPWWLSRDGVHVSAAGHRARAVAITKAVQTRCA